MKNPQEKKGFSRGLHDFLALGNTGVEKAVFWVTEFICSTRIIMGSGAVSRLKELGAKKLLLVTDPYFVKTGAATQVLQAAAADQSRVFDRIEPDPSVSLAAEGTALMKEFQPDCLVALGGGSAMDCAKAMAYFSGSKALLVAIPTTSGSGSEVTDFAILTHGGVKHPLVDKRLRPDVAILDDDFLKELPPGLVADTGFDVLSHALEALVAKNRSPMTDALARDAFCTAFAQLPASFGGNRQVRLKLHGASCMAGMAFTQAGLGLCHAMAHSLGGLYHVPHGRLNAILLPAVMECNAAVCGEQYAKLARDAGLGGSADTIAVRNLRNGLIRLRKELKLPGTLAQAGVEPGKVWRDTPAIVSAALADPCCQTNPCEVADFMVRKILDEVTGRG